MSKENLDHEFISIAKFISGAFAGVGIAFAVIETTSYLIITGLAISCYGVIIEKKGRFITESDVRTSIRSSI